MATFVNDTFTDTNGVLLHNHTGETGATWTEHPNILGTDASIQANTAQHSAEATATGYYASGLPATNEYDVQLTTGSLSSSNLGMGPYGRLLTNADTNYLAWCAGGLFLYKVVAGVYTELGTFGTSVASGSVIKLEIRTAAKKVFVDEVERISSADDGVTGTGRAGLRFYSYANTAILDTFSADDPVSASLPRPIMVRQSVNRAGTY